MSGWKMKYVRHLLRSGADNGSTEIDEFTAGEGSRDFRLRSNSRSQGMLIIATHELLWRVMNCIWRR